MKPFHGHALSWKLSEEVIELAMHHPPSNEIGSAMLEEMEQFTVALEPATPKAKILIIYSQLESGFSAGGDLREMYSRLQAVSPAERCTGVRGSLKRNHSGLNALDASPLVTIAAVHGFCFGGGFELALACDLIVADAMARFCFPELRLGLIPAGGGIPRLKRDLGNGLIRDLILTGRSMNAKRALSLGLISQVAAEGQALHVARSTAAQITKFDAVALRAAKRLIKPIPYGELNEEVEIVSQLFGQPAVMDGLRKAVESPNVLRHLP
jgi:enoyl-CoA hydratase/carnithine racemase